MKFGELEKLFVASEADPAQSSPEPLRKAFGHFLKTTLEGNAGNQSIGDYLRQIEAVGGTVEVAVALLRALSLQGVVPLPNQTNQISRCAVALVERNLPETAKYFLQDPRAQTYEKYPIVEAVHSKVCKNLLHDFGTMPSDFGHIVRSRQKVLHILSYGILREYCDVFGWRDLQQGIQRIMDIFCAINIEDYSFPEDCEECEQVLLEFEALCESVPSFLTQQFFIPFLRSCREGFHNFLSEVSEKTAAEIRGRIPGNGVLLKRIPLHQKGRSFSLSIPLSNVGPGVAVDVKCELDVNARYLNVEANKVSLGAVAPGDFACTFTLTVLEPCLVADFIVSVDWTAVGRRDRKSLVLSASIEAQRTDIDWEALGNQRPYSTDVAKGESFVGRQEAVKSLANRLLRTPMESCYISGQKRVGKTSLAYAGAAYAVAHAPQGMLAHELVLWGDIAYEDSRTAIGVLANTFAELMIADLPSELVRGLALDFQGTMAPLVKLARLCERYAPGKKYVLSIDEFDDIHPDLYYAGNLAEAFFANIRALSSCDNVCLILIGGENMPFVMDRQGQKLNKFIPVKVDYFSRATEWEDYKDLVRKPTLHSFNWHEDAISEVFNLTNGNPFFTKIVCGAVFENGIAQRDADVTADDVRRAADKKIEEIESNSFSHLWEDGILKEKAQRDLDAKRRRATLAAMARAMRSGQLLTHENIKKANAAAALEDSDILPTLNDFARREILREKYGQYSFQLPLFAKWIMEAGPARLISDPIGEELAAAAAAREERAFVRAQELADLADSWPTYQGREIGAERIRHWLEQVGTNEERRILFTLLSHLKFYHEGEIREKLRMVHSYLLRRLPVLVRKSHKEMRADVAVVYLDGEGKSGQWYASKYAEENFLSTQNIFSAEAFEAAFLRGDKRIANIKGLVIVDDVIGSGRTLAESVPRFINANKIWLHSNNIPILVAVVAATASGLEVVKACASKCEGVEVDVRACDVIVQEQFAFSEECKIWQSQEQREKAKALCVDLGARVYPKSPLGFAALGMLIAFPDACPNTTLPIIHSANKRNQPQWRPLLRRIANG